MSESLKELDVSGNRFGDLGMAAVANLVVRTRTLEMLAVDGNNVGLDSLHQFFEVSGRVWHWPWFVRGILLARS